MKLKDCYSKLKIFFKLSLEFAKVEFKLKNEGSYLGIFWYLLNPIIVFLIVFLVFSDRLGNTIPYYALYLIIGIIMFDFFQNSTIESPRIIENNRWVIKSINFPREALIGGVILQNIFSHIFEVFLLALMVLCFKVSFIGIFYYFILLIFFALFTFGVSLLLSSLEFYFVDIENLWIFAVKILWLATPIFYAIEGQLRLLYFNLINPLFYFIATAREIIIFSRLPEPWIVLGMVFSSILFLTLGLWVFSKLKHKFPELI